MSMFAAGDLDYIAKLNVVADRPGRRNFIRNGDFQIAQRGTSFAAMTTNQYTLDGVRHDGSGGTNTFTQQAFTVGQTDVPGNPLFFLRMQRTVAAGGAGSSLCVLPIELPQRLSGKTVTYSFYAKVASGTKLVQVDLVSGGVTPTVDTNGQGFTFTTSWQRFQFTETVPAMTATTASAYIVLRLYELSGVGTFTVDLADVQLEISQEATAFERLEYFEQWLWAQRFLPTLLNDSGATGSLANGQATAPGSAVILLPHRVVTRVPTTGIAVSAAGHFSCTQPAGAFTAGTAVSFVAGQKTATLIQVTGMVGLTAGHATLFAPNNAASRIHGTGAEL